MTAAPSAEDQPPRTLHVTAAPSRSRQPRLDWMLLLPPALTLAVMLWGISSASFWRDEAATLSATRRTLPQLLRMLGHEDAVHGAYDLLMWPLVRAAGTSELAARLPSAIAMAAAALAVAAIGRRLAARPTGLLAGLVFAALPAVSRYGQEARSYALATAMAALASYLLIRILDEPRRCWFVAYGLSVAALGLLNLFGLLLVPAHAVTVVRAWSDDGARGRQGGSAGGRAGQDGRWARLARWWAVTAGAACAASAPVALLAWHERSQVSWLRKPGWSDLHDLAAGLAGGTPPLLVIAAAGVTGVLYAALRGCAWSGSRSSGSRSSGSRSSGWGGVGGVAAPASARLIWMSAPWLLLPPAILLAVSAVTPVYLFRYVVFCVPALALMAGAVLAATARFSPLPAIAALGALALLSFPAQRGVREPAGHLDNIRAVARLLQAQQRPGDAIIFDDPGTRVDSFAYRYGFAGLRDISQLQSPSAAGNLGGSQAPVSVLLPRLTPAARVWLVEVGQGRHPDVAIIRWPRFRLSAAWSISDIRVRLYLHR